jgi:D-alanyl-D-alanine carboxypeptidase
MRPDTASLLDQLGISLAAVTARGLCECAEADTLELAETGADGRAYLLVPAAAGEWRRLKAAADADGITLFLASAFRSVARQTEIIEKKLAAGNTIETILTLCAPPGFSEHHSGRAVDIACPDAPPLEIEFEQTAAFAWLTQNAAHFGFALSYPRGNSAGYQYEPWHWCFNQPA